MTKEMVSIPANLPAFLQNMPELAALNTDAMQGLSVGMPPSIGLNGTRFIVKENGEETTLPSLEIAGIILKAKATIDKAWYATKYTPGVEVSAPDCFSKDGQRPDPMASSPQHDSCAGCPQNEYGSGKDAQGNPSKGKACRDSKVLAIYTNNNVYQFNIPPASLKAFAGYVRTLTQRGVYLPACITKIGFDPAFTYPVLTFEFGGYLTEEQFTKILPKISSQEVCDIVGGTPAALPAAPAPTQVKVEEKPTAAKKNAAPKVQPITPEVVEEVPAEAQSAAPSDADLAAALGISL